MKSLGLLLFLFCCLATAGPVHSVRDGAFSEPSTWNRAPVEGDDVEVRHTVSYDVESDTVLASIHISGALVFARDRSTRLNVGLLRIDPRAKAGGVEDVDEQHGHTMRPRGNRARLEVGTPERPIPHPHKAVIRLHAVDGQDPDEAPAIICRPGGILDLHGAPMHRTWLDLTASTEAGATTLELSAPPQSWQVGDELLITGASHRRSSDDEYQSSEQRIIRSIKGKVIHLDRALEHPHAGEPERASEVANLSRSVVVESAEPDTARGHTMYHRHAAGGISYVRLAGLGKKGVLGRYPVHFHLVRDSLRGSSVVGAAITDSHNRWVAIHGTEYMVVRDCVGFGSIGHGYFLEDGTEVFNVLDRNLGVQAMDGRRLPEQSLPFDPNDGAAFWWANGRNSFTRNVACENETYGFRFDSQKRSNFDSNLTVLQPDGTRARVDIRTLPHYRFESNESHTEGLYAMVFAGTEGAGPDRKHPHVLRDLSIWETHYGLRAQIPFLLVDKLRIDHAAYGIYRPWFDHHVYHDLEIHNTNTEPFNRGLDDKSIQHGPISVDGLTMTGVRRSGMPMIQISANNPGGKASSHFRHVTVEKDAGRAVVNLGGGPRLTPKTPTGVPIVLHDWYGEGRSAEVVSTRSPEFKADPDAWREDPPLTGDESRVREIATPAFPQLLEPVDDLPPVSVITWPRAHDVVEGVMITVRGTSTDNTDVVAVAVNGTVAKPVDGSFHQWTAEIFAAETITAIAEDWHGNVERNPHVLTLEKFSP